ncbi:hypothetical protein BD626DRAFT_414481 [Schizophyllum amplum]|uniref:Dihydrodipicolinate synthetase n=1 Tax=Schizophyllum amplum TaxID=97359 RepID=A0A550BUL2_9AGAR|nr:hypothetical protein BD626DRAFT_414481 [Auriculariopsis ampla]
MAANGVNGHKISRPLKPGIYAPIPTFFKPDSEDLDLPTTSAHIARCAKCGIAPLVGGSMGEAHHMSHAERIEVIKAARKALDDIGLHTMPVIAGTGAGSTRETIQVTQEAAEAGADYAIVITSGYFAGALANNRPALKAFFKDVSESSPIPVMIYNFPAAAGGIDLDSDIITEMGLECPNICGVKLTCGNVGKYTRIADAVVQPNFTPRKNPDAPFLVLGGFVDFLVPTTFANGHGTITGLANLAPNTIAKLWELSCAALKDISLLQEALRVQGIAARADFTIAKTAIPGMKFLIEKEYGYGGLARKPLASLTDAEKKAIWEHPHTQDLLRLEHELSGKSKA